MGQSAGTGWLFWIDRGGTFTDIIGRDPENRLHVRKLLSDNPDRYADAGVAGIQQIMSDSGLAGPIEEIRLGTTVATNALLERRGEPTLLVVTAGFEDALRIGTQARPDIFALDIRLPEPAWAAVTAAHERLDARGEILQPLDERRLAADLESRHAQGYRSVAICLLHAWRNPAHERRAQELALRAGFDHVSLSHEVSPLRQFVGRGDTTVADAYLSPVLDRYRQQLATTLKAKGLAPRRLLFMQSNGGLVDAQQFRGKDSVLSGPAGGIVGMVTASAEAGNQRLIGFDMGGTSTDVSLYAGRLEYDTDNEIAGVRLRAPMLRIHTVAAGGGSILKFAAGRFQVGPGSAGADPGPAAYRNGGPLTVTDANLLLGRLLPDYFPHAFGPDGSQPLDQQRVRQSFDELTAEINTRTDHDLMPEAVAEGFVRIAVDNMANAIKRISIQRGYDPAGFTLCCFGGAGGQHACRVAEALGIESILIHPLAGVLSAFGIGTAPLRAYRQRTVDCTLDDTALAGLDDQLTADIRAVRDELIGQGCRPDSFAVSRTLFVRTSGSETTLPVDYEGRGDIAAGILAGYGDAHRQRFGFEPADTALLIEAYRIEISGRLSTEGTDELFLEPARHSRAPSATTLYCRDAWCDAAVHDRLTLRSGVTLDGPAVIIDDATTIIVEPGWQLNVMPDGQLRLQLLRVAGAERIDAHEADPVLLEVFNSHFMNIAEQMGAVLENAAQSVNIRERLDFSCALFDQVGRLIANAPHIPVHLGSMGDSVAAILDNNAGRISPGDVFMLNSPYRGGSHLPDVTVVTPVFDAAGKTLEFVVASRAHHADIGGLTPGSMPPDSRTIDEEGVLFDNFRLVEDGRFRTDALRTALTAGDYPARNPDQNIADLRAQVAANEKGRRELRAMTEHFGTASVRAYMDHVRANAESAVRAIIDRIGAGEMSLELDNGARICVRVEIDQDAREALVDFTGTSGQSETNFNAPVSVTRAAVLYVFRTLIAENIPLNAGCLAPIHLRVPAGCLLNPAPPAAVVAGNVETSQCITNALYGALGVVAASQCTMNNLTFGDDRLQYYETICGGSGAGPDFDGSAAVHTHMTNSRMTDPEVIETRYPVLIRAFGIRRGSGGAGLHNGGDGVFRHIEFRAPMTAAILSNNRRAGPFGLHGGADGLAGRNVIRRRDGTVEAVDSVEVMKLEAGDTLIIETPGGGGYGAAQSVNINETPT